MLNKERDKQLEKQKEYKELSDKQLEEAKTETDPEKRIKLLEQSRENKERSNFSEQIAQTMGQKNLDLNMKFLSNLKPPAMEQVNSLASIGYMVDKNQDKEDLKEQSDFLREQTTIQKQIRDQLKTMNTSSTFS